MTTTTKGLRGYGVHADEERRDLIVREYACPVCQAAPGEPCVYGRTSLGNAMRQATSHEGRYLAACHDGAVPPLPRMALCAHCEKPFEATRPDKRACSKYCSESVSKAKRRG